MTLLEQELLDTINESYELLGLDDRYNDIVLSETVTQADIKKYNDIFKQANKLIKDNGGKAQFQNILNILLLMLQYCLSFIGKIGINAATAGLPINQKTMIKSNDGKVIIVSIEDLEYGRKAEVNTGVNLTELADLMRYYGAYNAANFDGGGSTQLLVNQNNIMTVKVRSSDYGEAYFVENSRLVMNTIMVVSK